MGKGVGKGGAGKGVMRLLLGTKVQGTPHAAEVRRVMAQYEKVFDELVRQVAVHCIERGQCLTRVWQHLSTTVDAFFSSSVLVPLIAS